MTTPVPAAQAATTRNAAQAATPYHHRRQATAQSVGPVATLSRPPRSEAEAREGRKARAELDAAVGLDRVVLSLDTQPGFDRLPAPGRLVVAEGEVNVDEGPERRSCVLACWQDATTGALVTARVHRHLACALEDVARRLRAGTAAFVPGFQR